MTDGKILEQEQQAFLLDTFVSVTLYDGSEETAQGALDLCRRYEAVFSRTGSRPRASL